MAEEDVQFSWFRAIARFSHQKSRFFRSRHQLPPACDRNCSEREKSRFFSNYVEQIDFSWHFCDFFRVPIEDSPKSNNSEHDSLREKRGIAFDTRSGRVRFSAVGWDCIRSRKSRVRLGVGWGNILWYRVGWEKSRVRFLGCRQGWGETACGVGRVG